MYGVLSQARIKPQPQTIEFVQFRVVTTSTAWLGCWGCKAELGAWYVIGAAYIWSVYGSKGDFVLRTKS